MTLDVWQHIRQEAKELAENEPMLASFFHSTILKHQNLGGALSYLLANKLANLIMPAISLREIIEEAYQANRYSSCSPPRPCCRVMVHSIALFKRFPCDSKLSNHPLFMESKP